MSKALHFHRLPVGDQDHQPLIMKRRATSRPCSRTRDGPTPVNAGSARRTQGAGARAHHHLPYDKTDDPGRLDEIEAAAKPMTPRT